MDWNASVNGAFSDLFTKRNVFLLFSFWLGGLAILAAYGTSPSRLARRAPICGELPVQRENAGGAFVASRRGAEAGGPAYNVICDDLHLENGRFGVFRTASHRVMHIGNLRVTFSEPATTPGCHESGAAALGAFFSLFAPRRGGLGLFHELQGPEQGFSITPDSADTTEVHIRGLDWEIRRAETTVFQACCRRAALESGSFEVVLRGHARLTTPWTTLESNCIRLDMQNNRIVADGPYVLTRDGTKEPGVTNCGWPMADFGFGISDWAGATPAGTNPSALGGSFCHPVPSAGCATAAEPVDDRIAAGRARMFEGTAAGFAEAYRTFDAALKETNGSGVGDGRQLAFLHALSRGALLFAHHPDVVSADGFFALAETFGITPTAGALADIKAVLSGGMEGDRAPSDSAAEGDGTGWTVPAELDAVLAELDAIADAPARFAVRFTPEETGLAEDVEVDYGEVLILKALLLSYRGMLAAQTAESLAAEPDIGRAESGLAPGIPCAPLTSSACEIGLWGVVDRCINNALYRQSARLCTEVVGPLEADEAGLLAQSARSLAEGVACYLRAIDYMRLENQPAGTDPQEDEFLYLGPGAAEQIGPIQTRVPALSQRLADRTITAPDFQAARTFDLHDTNGAFLGELMLADGLPGPKDDGGRLTMKDGTVLTVEWIDIGPDNTVAIDLRGRATWRQVWFEGTFTPGHQRIVDGTMEDWGDGRRLLTGVTARRAEEPPRPREAHAPAATYSRIVGRAETTRLPMADW